VFLLVDLVNNIDKLAEDKFQILDNALKKAEELNANKLQDSVRKLCKSQDSKTIYTCVGSKEKRC
jgi:hypothetical protein